MTMMECKILKLLTISAFTVAVGQQGPEKIVAFNTVSLHSYKGL